jgi:integrase
VRAINFPEIVVSLLRQHKREQNEQRLKLGNLRHDTNLVFTQWNGLQMATGTPTSWIRKFIKGYNAKVEQDEALSREEKYSLKLPEIGIKGLRHTSATLMIANHTDVRTVSARLGHSQTSTTMDIYSHALRASDKKAADALQTMLGKKSGKQEKKVK